MLLAIDIGNTGITIGVFEDENLRQTVRLNSDASLSVNEYIKNFRELLKDFDITNCIISSVVNELDNVIESAVKTVFNIEPIIVSAKINTGVKINIDNPSCIGADRIVNACAACMKYSLPAIVVDFGTAITFDIVDIDGNFAGGIIMPGLQTQLKSLFNNTSKLPEINLEHIDTVIGKNTKENILSGVVLGTAEAVAGLIKRCRKEVGQNAVIIATGGNSKFISRYIPDAFDYVEPEFTLEGLRYLYDLNSKQHYH